MAAILHAVAGLGEAAQQDVVDQLLLRRAGDPFQQFLEQLGLDPLGGDRQPLIEVGDEFLKCRQLLLAGRFVNPEELGDALPVEPVGDRLVGGQHELLDQTVGEVALGAHDLLGYDLGRRLSY